MKISYFDCGLEDTKIIGMPNINFEDWLSFKDRISVKKLVYFLRQVGLYLVSYKNDLNEITKIEEIVDFKLDLKSVDLKKGVQEPKLG